MSDLTKCIKDDCLWPANYRYIFASNNVGKKLGMCFGHATIEKRFRGRIERMWTP